MLSEQRALHLRMHSAAERHDQLLRDFPATLKRASLKHLASPLGITPETVSRLRSCRT